MPPWAEPRFMTRESVKAPPAVENKLFFDEYGVNFDASSAQPFVAPAT